MPTEAEWEYAARVGLKNNVYPWGNEPVNSGQAKANSWEGNFPFYNERKDGYVRSAPVETFKPHNYSLYDMLVMYGNGAVIGTVRITIKK